MAVLRPTEMVVGVVDVYVEISERGFARRGEDDGLVGLSCSSLLVVVWRRR